VNWPQGVRLTVCLLSLAVNLFGQDKPSHRAAARTARHSRALVTATLTDQAGPGMSGAMVMGALPQLPLESIAPVPPTVSYREGKLTIVALNSTLGDILSAVSQQTGAQIEIPEAPDRVVTRLGPGPACDVVAELLKGSGFDFVLLGSPAAPGALTRVELWAKSVPSKGTRPSALGTPGNPVNQPVAASSPVSQATAEPSPEAEGILESKPD
jgi:hypothetical protein